MSYSFIGYQTAYAATRWNPIYWNTACLIVNSGSLETDSDDAEVKEKNSDYSKLAKALGTILSNGIKVSLIDINKSQFSFEPDIENNQILFGLKALSGINSETISQIIAGRPYRGIADFMARCPLNKTQMISLIKSGAFDSIEAEWGKELNTHPRYVVMAYYLSKACEPKNKLNLQNFNTLVQRNLIPESLSFEKKVFEFNKYLKANTKVGQYFVFNDICNTFYKKHFDIEKLEIINGVTCIKQKTWDNIYQKEMDSARDWLKTHQNEVLNELNTQLFMEIWDKYAQGNLSSWEMQSLCCYYHEHELANVDIQKYGITDFFTLNPESEVDYHFKRNGVQIPVFKTFKIIGTVLNKDDTRAMVTLLTPTGVVSVKFTKEYYAEYKRRISETQENGSKKVTEKGWFGRGNLLMITGYRRDSQFVAKTYSKTSTHQLYKITLLNGGRDMELTHERKDAEE